MSLLSLHNVTHHFGGLCAVSGLNLRIEPGELVGLIGPNGAGKTTVFNLITGIYRPTAGSIRFGDRDITGCRPSRITSLGIARTFQNIRLFGSLSALDNVRVSLYNRTRYSTLEALFQAGRFRHAESRSTDEAFRLLMALGLLEHADTPAASLPYGLQRRLEIARALATGARLLLLDEPAAGMNPSEVGRLMEFITRIRAEFHLTLLLIEHQMRLVMGICERIHVLDFGATIAEGHPAEIRAHPRVLEAYLGEPPPATPPPTP